MSRLLKEKPAFLTEQNSKTNIEDRVTYVLSECFNDSSPFGQERYREYAKTVIREIKSFKITKTTRRTRQ